MGVDSQMLVRTHKIVTDEQIIHWAWQLHASFNVLHAAHSTQNYGGPGVHALERVGEYAQDAPSLFPEKGETFIEVSMSCRFYGPGYERGPLPEIMAVAHWLELRIPGASVWYGGDSAGCAAAPFGYAERDRLWAHFVAVGHAPYYGGFGCNDPRMTCDFCNGKPMHVHMWHGGDRGYACPGCSAHVVVDGSGAKTFVDSNWKPLQKAVV